MRLLFLLLLSFHLVASASDLQLPKAHSPNGRYTIALAKLSESERRHDRTAIQFVDLRSRLVIGSPVSLVFGMSFDDELSLNQPHPEDFKDEFTVLWSRDSSFVAITYTARHWSLFHAFRLVHGRFVELIIPDLKPVIKRHVGGHFQTDGSHAVPLTWARRSRLIVEECGIGI